MNSCFLAPFDTKANKKSNLRSLTSSFGENVSLHPVLWRRKSIKAFHKWRVADNSNFPSVMCREFREIDIQYCPKNTRSWKYIHAFPLSTKDASHYQIKSKMSPKHRYLSAKPFSKNSEGISAEETDTLERTWGGEDINQWKLSVKAVVYFTNIQFDFWKRFRLLGFFCGQRFF